MEKSFTWERPPFETCPYCKSKDKFGILSAGGDHFTMRCVECRQSHSEVLPELDKKLIYLDQFVFSNLFHLENEEREIKGNAAFWKEVHKRLKNLVLLQQILLPHSDVHHLETLVSIYSNDLRKCYEHIGGDARLIDTNQLSLHHSRELMVAFIDNRPPRIERGPDQVLERERNTWLDDMHISVNADYSQFEDAQRASNDRSEASLNNLVAFWQREKPSYKEVLELELGTHARERKRTVLELVMEGFAAENAGDIMASINLMMHPIMNEYVMLHKGFERVGVEESDIANKIYDFWNWEEHRKQPESLIAAHLFAGMARKVVGGKKEVDGSFLNDVRAISSYAPFVDAMFVDNECHALLYEARNKLEYRAKVFSLNTKDEFIDYLKQIEADIPSEIREYTNRIYGV